MKVRVFERHQRSDPLVCLRFPHVSCPIPSMFIVSAPTSIKRPYRLILFTSTTSPFYPASITEANDQKREYLRPGELAIKQKLSNEYKGIVLAYCNSSEPIKNIMKLSFIRSGHRLGLN